MPDGIYLSDMLVGEKRDVSEEMTILAPGATPFANSIGTFTNPAQATGLKHEWIDDARRPMHSTVNGGIAAGVTAIVFDDDCFKVGMYLATEGGEIICLTVKTAAKSFTITRSAGTIAAATIADGAEVVLAANPNIEGAAAGDSDWVYDPGERYNYCARLEKIVEVSDEANKAMRYGRPGTQFDDNAAQIFKHAQIEIEMTQLLSPLRTAPAPSTPTAGQCMGLNEWLLAAGQSTDCGGTDLTQGRIRTMVEAIAPYYEDGERIPAVLLHPISQSFVFDSWQQAHVQVAPGDPHVATYGTNVQRLRIGPMDIDCIPMGRLSAVKHSIVYKPDLIRPAFYLPLTFEMLSRDGGRKRGMLSASHTVQVRAPAAGWCFYDVA